MTISQLIVFAAIYFVAVSTPGPGVAAIVARGLAQGMRGSVPYIAGFVVGDLIWLTVATTGLAVIAQTFATLFIAIKYAGCVYLLYMAWVIWHSPVLAKDVEAKNNFSSAWPSFIESLMLTLGNPKVIVFFLSIMPLVIDMSAISPLIYIQLIGMAFFVLTPVLFAWLYLADRARRIFTSETALRRMNKVTAGIMAGAAVALAAKS